MESARSPFRRGTQVARVVRFTPVLHHGGRTKAELRLHGGKWLLEATTFSLRLEREFPHSLSATQFPANTCSHKGLEVTLQDRVSVCLSWGRVGSGITQESGRGQRYTHI